MAVNALLIASVVTLALAFIFIVIGAGTEEWIKNGRAGLLPVESYFTDQLKASAALLIIALLASIVCLCLMGVYLLLELMGKALTQAAVMPTISLAVSILGAISGIVACILFADAVGSGVDFGYSFALTIVGSIFLVIGGIMGRVARKNSTQVG